MHFTAFSLRCHQMLQLKMLGLPISKTMKFLLFRFETLHFKYLLRNIFLFSSCSNEKS